MTLTVPHTAIPGKKIVASKYNENNNAIADAVNTNSTNISDIQETLEACIKEDASVPFKKSPKNIFIDIQGATWATPIVITAPNHGRETGEKGCIIGVNGNSAANGEWTITVQDKDSFSLDGSVGNGIWTNGGVFYVYPKNNEDHPSKLYIDNKTNKFDPFTIVSGTVNSSGVSDLFEALVQTAYTNPVLTSATTSGVTITYNGSPQADGPWRILGDFAAQNLVTMNVHSGTVFIRATFDTSAYLTDFYTPTNGGNLGYGAPASPTFTVKFYKDDVPVYTRNCTLGEHVILPSAIYYNSFEVTNIATNNPDWCCIGPFKLNGYTLSGTGGSNTVLKFKVGGNYDKLVLCYSDKYVETIDKLKNITGLANGVNYIIKEKGVNDPIVTQNSVTEGVTFPASPISGDYFCYKAKGITTYKYNGATWVETQYVLLGIATVASGVITSISSMLFGKKSNYAHIYAQINSNISVNIAVAGTYVGVASGSILLGASSSAFTWANGVGTCVKSGTYRISYEMAVNCATAAKKLQSTVFKNGAAVNGSSSASYEATASQDVALGGEFIGSFVMGDTIQLAVTNSTTALPVIIDCLNMSVTEII